MDTVVSFCIRKCQNNIFGILLISYLLTEVFAMSSPDKLRYLKDMHITYVCNFYILVFFFILLKNSGLSFALFKETFYAKLSLGKNSWTPFSAIRSFICDLQLV